MNRYTVFSCCEDLDEDDTVWANTLGEHRATYYMPIVCLACQHKRRRVNE
jgi:hypothetical protein